MKRRTTVGIRSIFLHAAFSMGLAAIALAAVACGSAPNGPTASEATASLPPAIVYTFVASTTQGPAEATPGSTATTPTAAAVATATGRPTLASQPPIDPTPDGQVSGRRVRLPILMYHYVEPLVVGADVLRVGLTVKRDDFAAQMAYLHQHGYVTVSLYELVDALALGRSLPARAVVLTFDDGYRTLMDNVVPVLQPYGYTGTIFVITQFMDDSLPQYLTWPQAESLYAQGWKIEPHTKTHESLAGRGRDFQLYQMLGSIQTVAAHIGTTPRFIAYPSGKYDALTLELTHEMNLWGGVTVDFGRVHGYDDRYKLTRVRIDGRGSLQDFINGLEGDLRP